ncbi:MAG: trehalose-phosphatase [Jatrophihabitantaceae bacterium]
MPVTDVTAVLTAMRGRLSRALIALDFDGTLAQIVTDPAKARPEPGALQALAALARAGAQIAVITGRDANTAIALGGFDAVPGLLVEGLYGAETWQAGQLETPTEPAVVGELRARLPAVVAACTGDAGVWIEDKRLSLVVHTRQAAQPAAAIEAVRGPVSYLAAQLGLETHDGRDVLEVRLPGFDKGAVLRRLINRFDPTAVLFAGDDLGDVPAFATIREVRANGRRAWSIAASGEVPDVRDAADLQVDGPAGLVALLTSLAEDRGQPSASSCA